MNGPAAVKDQAVDMFVHCAGTWENDAFVRTPSAEILDILAVNVMSFLATVAALSDALRRADRGWIVGIGLISGLENGAGIRPAYAAAKFGLRGAVHSLREVFRGSTGLLLAAAPEPHPLRQQRGLAPLPASPVADKRGAVRAARRLNRASGTIATSVLIDSAMEHYRGAFQNKAMYTPIVISALTILASFHGHKDQTARAHWARDSVYALAGLAGTIGTGFHILQCGQAAGRILLAKPVLCRPAWSPDGDVPGGDDGIPGRACA